jgi:hypothetical protein
MGLLRKQLAKWQSNIQPNTKDLPLSRGNDKPNPATPNGVKFSHVAGAIGFFQVCGQKVFFSCHCDTSHSYIYGSFMFS